MVERPSQAPAATPSRGPLAGRLAQAAADNSSARHCWPMTTSSDRHGIDSSRCVQRKEDDASG